MRARRILSKQEQAVEDSANPREYYYKILNAKKNGDSWAIDIPCDSIVYFADQVILNLNFLILLLFL